MMTAVFRKCVVKRPAFAGAFQFNPLRWPLDSTAQHRQRRRHGLAPAGRAQMRARTTWSSSAPGVPERLLAAGGLGGGDKSRPKDILNLAQSANIQQVRNFTDDGYDFRLEW